MYQYSHLEDYIRDTYQDIGIGRPDQLNMYWIADQLDIGLYLKRDKSEAMYWESRFYIFLDRSLSPQQRWQEFGHELCHVLRHDGDQGRLHPLFVELQEWQADNFAYHFCVPTFMLQEIALPRSKLEAAQLIAHTFAVELAFAEERLERYLKKLYPGGFQVAETRDSIYSRD